MGEDGITVKVNLDTSDFPKMGSESKKAADSFSKNVSAGIQKASASSKKFINNFTKFEKGFSTFGTRLFKSSTSGLEKVLGKTLGDLSKKGVGVFKKSVVDAERGAESFVRQLVRLGPSILGITGAFQILHRATSSYLSENKRVSNQLQASWRAIGNVIGPVVEWLVNLFATAVSYLIKLLNLLGFTSKSASEASKKAGGAAKEMMSVMGFDELNKLNDNSGGGGGSGSLSDLELPDWLEKLGEMLKNGLFKEAGEWLGNFLNNLVDSVDWDGLGRKIGTWIKNALDFAVAFIKTFDWKNLGNQIMTAINAAIEEIPWTEVGEFLASWLYIGISFAGGMLEKFNGANAASALADMVLGFTEMIIAAIQKIDWRQCGENIASFIRTLWLRAPQILIAVFNLAKTIVTALVDFIAGLFKIDDSKVTKIKNAIEDFFKSIEVGIDLITVKPGQSSEDGDMAAKAIAVIAGLLGFAPSGSIWMAALSAGVSLAITGDIAAEDKGIGVANLLNDILDILPYAGGTIGLFRGGPGGAATGYGIGNAIKLIVEGAIDSETGELTFNKDNFIQTIVNKLNGGAGKAGSVAAMIAGGLMFTKTRNLGLSAVTATFASGVVSSLVGAVTLDESGSLIFDKDVFTKSIMEKMGLTKFTGAIAGGIGGAKLFAKYNGNVFWGFAIGAALSFALMNAFEFEDGKPSFNKETFIKEIVGFVALAAVGAIIGAVAGGPGGAAIGLKIGAGIWLVIQSLKTLFGGKSKEEYVEDVYDELVTEFGDEFVIEKAADLNVEIDPENVSASMSPQVASVVKGYVYNKAMEAINSSQFGPGFKIDATNASGFAQNLVNLMATELANAKVSDDKIAQFSAIWGQFAKGINSETALNQFKENIGSAAQTLADQAASELAKAAEDNRRAGEFMNALLKSNRVSPEDAEWFVTEYKTLGEETAKKYAEAVLSGDFDGTAQEFVEKYAKAIREVDTGSVEDAASSNVGEAVVSGAGKKVKDNMPEELKTDTVNSLIQATADNPTKENAQSLGEMLVDGFCTGLANKQEALVTTISTVVGAGLDAIDGSDGKITTWYNAFSTSKITGYLDGIRDAINTYLNGEFTTSVINGSLNTALTTMDTSVQTTADNIKGYISNMASTVSGIMGSLAGAARGWGRDIGSQIAYGMMDTIGMVSSAASRIADIIYRYLHFSEPDVGPLKDFHTFMPDMMRLMAEGINQNADKPESAIGSVAESMAEKMSMLGQLNGIANNVDFQMPAMAMGTVMPYSVASGRTQTKEAQQDSMFEMLVGAFTEALNNMKPTENYVYLDGKQIADSTTKWQRRADRAGGK